MLYVRNRFWPGEISQGGPPPSATRLLLKTKREEILKGPRPWPARRAFCHFAGSGGRNGTGEENASLRACIDRITTQEPTTSAPRHSEDGMRASPSNMTNPPQVMSPNMEQNQSQDTTSVRDTPPDEVPLPPKKRERLEEDLSPRSEPTQSDVKEEQEIKEEQERGLKRSGRRTKSHLMTQPRDSKDPSRRHWRFP